MISDALAEAKEKMTRAVEVCKDDFATVRTGRANPALFEKIMVEYYGTPTPLQQLASLQNPEARTLPMAHWPALQSLEQAVALQVQELSRLGPDVRLRASTAAGREIVPWQA